MEMELERVFGLAVQLKRKRSRLSGSQASAKKSRSGEDGSSSVTSVDEEVGSSCSSSSIDDEQVVEVQRQGRDYADVADLFLRGLGVLLSDTSIEGIEKVYESEGSRCEFEKKQVEMERDGGDANVQWAWYGACKEEIESIVENGFRMAVPSSVGYCFAPVECSRISAVQAKEDDVGEQRLILCQVAVGKVGLITSKNKNDQSFDTGVYDSSSPKVLILPAARFEPSRILLHHVVRFKLSNQWREIIQASTIVGKYHLGSQSQRKTKLKALSPGAPIQDGLSKHSMTSCKIMSFPTLFWILQSKIPQLNLSELQQKYDAFKNGGVSKLDFIHEVRRIAGDALLYKCMCFIKLWSQGCEHAH